MKRTTKERGSTTVGPKPASQSPKTSTSKGSAKAGNNGPAKAEENKAQAASTKAPAKDAKPAPTDAWRGFKPGLWQRDVNVRWFIQQNYTPYEGDEAFLAGPTGRTSQIWKKLQDLFVE